VILFRVDGGVVERIRTLSPIARSIGRPAAPLADRREAAESVALLDTFATQRGALHGRGMSAIAAHSDRLPMRLCNASSHPPSRNPSACA